MGREAGISETKEYSRELVKATGKGSQIKEAVKL